MAKKKQVSETPIVESKTIVSDKELTSTDVVENIDGKIWTRDWRELVKVEGSRQDLRGNEYYGVKA